MVNLALFSYSVSQIFFMAKKNTTQLQYHEDTDIFCLLYS